MAFFFTSDFHLGDETLTSRGLRPFRSGTRMTEVIVKNVKARAKDPSDTVFHLGDFVAYGKDHGIESPRISGDEYRKLFDCNIVLLEGNHDPNNNVKTMVKTMFVDIGPYHNVSCSHFPSWYSQNSGLIPRLRGHIHLCGHVHGSWKTMVSKDGILNINVGLDVWNYQIVSIQDLIRLIQKEISKL